MAPVNMNRDYKELVVEIASGQALSEVVDFANWSSGAILIPAAWDAANIGFHVADDADETFYPLKDASGTILEITNITVDTWMVLPADLFGAHFFKLWSKATGAETDVNQTALRRIKIMLKG